MGSKVVSHQICQCTKKLRVHLSSKVPIMRPIHVPKIFPGKQHLFIVPQTRRYKLSKLDDNFAMTF